MRIVVWNCRMALVKKRDLLYGLGADIAVIPECSSEAMRICRQDGFETCWWGQNRHKGLGVMVRKPWRLEHQRRSCSQRWIASVRVGGPQTFRLLPVWACPVGGVREKNYVGQIYEAIVRHPHWFAAGCPTVIGGDFNSNTIFDPGRKQRTHSRVVRLLAARGLQSAYHEYFQEMQGRESRPTYYFWHRPERCFHLDYIFLPDAWVQKVTAVTVGTYREWRAASDHMPILVDIAEAAGPNATR
jgi:endonuclease/exonuclease/phosphatase family metal-dependent hydrolase